MMKHIAEYLSETTLRCVGGLLLAPYLQLVLVQDKVFHHEDDGSHMQPEHPSLFKVNSKFINENKL